MKKSILRTAIALMLAFAIVISVSLVAVSAQTESKVTFSVEALSIGNEFIIEPTMVQIEANETVAHLFDKVLKANNIKYKSYGTVEKDMYLSKIDFLNKNNIPKCITDKIGDFIDTGSETSLGEKDYSALAGWLFTVNNATPISGMSDCVLKNGDVVRIQFSLYWGADIGLANQMGMPEYGVSDFYPVANKDKAMRVLAETKDNVTESFKTAVTTADISNENMILALYNYLPIAYKDFILGDADNNGVINLKDAAYIQSYITDKIMFDFITSLKADANKDDVVNLKDSMTLQKLIIA